MKTTNLLLIALTLVMAGCVSVPVDPTPKQQLVANAVEDILSVGLVPILSKNASYIPAAQAIAVSLGTFSGTTLTPADVNAFLAKTTLSPEDAKAVAGIVNAAYDVFQRRYAQQVGTSLRPDLKLFLQAVSNGINNAIAAVPKT